jgi:hypothetical protein
MSTLNLTYAPLSAGLMAYSGGPESQLLRRLTADALSALALQSHAQAALNDLYSLQQEAPEMGLTLTTDALETSKRFLLAWPKTMPMPELTLDTDGEVVLDWIGPHKDMVTVSLRDDGRISYAAHLGARRRKHGTEAFDDAVPEAVLDAVRSAFAD